MFDIYYKNLIFRNCPRCGQEKIFHNWFKMKEKCDNCNILFIEQNGDNWFFLLIIDRALFIFPIIVAYYFNINPWTIIYLCISLMIVFILLTPYRLCLSLALDFFLKSRFYNYNK